MERDRYVLLNFSGISLNIVQTKYKSYIFRDGMASHVLRFVAVMDTNYSVDMSRRFIVSFYLSDDTIAVFEPPQRNSGVLGGKYLERGRVKLPGQEIFKSELTKYYTASDFYVGAKLMFNDITFIIVGADEYGKRNHIDYNFNNNKLFGCSDVGDKVKLISL